MTALHPRFWAKVEKTDTCWIWTACVTSRGYGCVGIDGSRFLVHRVSYEALVGPIPEGLTIDHLCGNKRCVKPTHLEPVTLRENILRAAANRTHCNNGHELTRSEGARQRRCLLCENERRRSRLSAQPH